MAESIHSGHRARLDERIRTHGLESLSPHEQLEWVLFRVIPQANTNDAAHLLIKSFGSVAGVFDAPPSELEKVKGIGKSAATFLSEIPRLLNIYNRDKMGKKIILDSAEKIGEYVLSLFDGDLCENLYVVTLAPGGRVINNELIARGSMEEVPMYVSEVVAAVVKSPTHSVILAHNHPAERLFPSMRDIQATEAAYAALKTLGIKLTDHVIAARGKYYSMAQRGELAAIML